MIGEPAPRPASKELIGGVGSADLLPLRAGVVVVELADAWTGEILRWHAAEPGAAIVWALRDLHMAALDARPALALDAFALQARVKR